jgi:hypothetical protein
MRALLRLTDRSPCEICRDESRDPHSSCVVSRGAGRSRGDRAQRALPRPLPRARRRIRADRRRRSRRAADRELEARVKTGEIKEVVLATNRTRKGDATRTSCSTPCARRRAPVADRVRDAARRRSRVRRPRDRSACRSRTQDVVGRWATQDLRAAERETYSRGELPRASPGGYPCGPAKHFDPERLPGHLRCATRSS